jgi:sensor histidine kinase YesM
MGNPTNRSLKKVDYRRIAYHLIFWLTMNLVWDFLSSYLKGIPISMDVILSDLMYFTPTQVFTVYFTLYYLFPKFLYKRKYYQFAFVFSLFFVGTIVLLVLPLNYSGYKEYMSRMNREVDIFQFFRYSFGRLANLNLMIVGLAATIKLLRKWLETQKKQRILEKETLEMNVKLQETKIKLIKAQINPNFLFSSLETLYVLTKQKSELAPEVVLKVSSLLDYMLYDSSREWIGIEREIENIKNYIDIKLANVENTFQIFFEFNGDFSGLYIKPSILLPTVENFFKYANQSKQHIKKFDIKIDFEDKQFKLKLIGNFQRSVDRVRLEELYSPVKSILDLQYATLYSLTFEEQNNNVEVFLWVKIQKKEEI